MNVSLFPALPQDLIEPPQISTRSDNQPEYAEPSNPDDPSTSVPPSDPNANDSVEGEPGIIESTELAPLGDEKVAADRESLARAVDFGLFCSWLHG